MRKFYQFWLNNYFLLFLLFVLDIGILTIFHFKISAVIFFGVIFTILFIIIKIFEKKGIILSILVLFILLLSVFSEKSIIIGFGIPHTYIIRDAINDNPLEKISVYYSVDVNVPNPGGESSMSVISGELITNSKGEITFPPYIILNLFGYSKYMRVNYPTDYFYERDKRNWFYEQSEYIELPRKDNIILLNRNEDYFNRINNLIRANTTYGLCNLNYLDSVEHLYNYYNNSDLITLPEHYDFELLNDPIVVETGIGN